MVDDPKKDPPPKNAGAGDARRRLDDRTVPVPVPRGGTLSADTLEADPKSFIGEERLQPSSAEPSAQTRVERPRPVSHTPQPSFDEEIAKNRAPAPRPATQVRRSPLASSQGAAHGPDEAAGRATVAETHVAAQVPVDLAASAAAETSGPSSSGVFASRATALEAHAARDSARADDAPIAQEGAATSAERADDARFGEASGEQNADDDAPTLPIDVQADGAGGTLSDPLPRTASSAPVANAPDADGGPTVEQTAALPLESLPPRSDPVGALPDRIDPAERERLANEATRIRSSKNSAAPSSGSRALKVVVLLVGLGVGAAATAAGVRAMTSPRADANHAPLAAHAAPPSRGDGARSIANADATRASAPAPIAGAPAASPAATPAGTISEREVVDVVNVVGAVNVDGLDRVGADAPAQPSAADTRAQPIRGGYYDASGSGALGLAQALAAGVRPAMKTAPAGLAVRGEVRRATVVGGEAQLDCNLTLVDAHVRRVTLQASARAADKGQKPDRLLRLAAERCGQSLGPELTQALAVLAQR